VVDMQRTGRRTGYVVPGWNQIIVSYRWFFLLCCIAVKRTLLIFCTKANYSRERPTIKL